MSRLELAAAVLFVKRAGMMKKKLAIDDVLEYLWTNSQVAIGYIRNIYTQKKHLKQLASKMNPAYHASRGLSASNSKHLDLLIFNSSKFL